MKIYKKVIACILTLMMFFAQMPVNVFAANQKNNIPLDIVLVLDVSGSMVDPITSTDTTKRITILKDSINQFIEEFAKNNSKQSDEKYQSRISIIKFSGKIPDNADKIGNDTYQENRNTYNYTQIMSDFFTATNDNKAKLEDVVNSISPAGATRSDFAMELALKQINQSKNDESRKDAKRIVFFVTDGQPTTFNNFDDDVANGAINTSKEIKKDAEVYTFGMFSLTDPSITGHVGSGSWSDAEKFNAYMHGVSSNYSDAQSYKNLGTRAENSAYYMGAKSSKEATAIFDSVIAKLLSMTYAGADYTDVDAAIGKYVASLVEDGSTIQLGIGNIPNAVANELKKKKHLGIHTEMFTETMVDLIECGAVDNSCKGLYNGYSVCSFTMGSQRLYDFINNNPSILFKSCTFTNDPYTIGKNNKFVSINATLEMDLMGQCASETVGYHQWSGTGGQSETVQGSQMSKGGKSIIAMHSTYTTKDADGNEVLHSKIVPCLHEGAVVTTSRNDVDYVVTEYGIAWLRGLNISERAEALIKIAHPAFRDELRQKAEMYDIW